MEGTDKDHGSPTLGSTQDHPQELHHVLVSVFQMLLELFQS